MKYADRLRKTLMGFTFSRQKDGKHPSGNMGSSDNVQFLRARRFSHYDKEIK